MDDSDVIMEELSKINDRLCELCDELNDINKNAKLLNKRLLMLADLAREHDNDVIISLNDVPPKTHLKELASRINKHVERK